MKKGKNYDHIIWLLEQLNKQASDQIFTNLSSKGKFEIREERLDNVLEAGLYETKSCTVLTLSLFFIQEADEHLIIKKKFSVYTDSFNEFYDHFYDDILMWLVHCKSNINTLEDYKNNIVKAYTASQLIKEGLSNKKGYLK